MSATMTPDTITTIDALFGNHRASDSVVLTLVLVLIVIIQQYIVPGVIPNYATK